MSRQADTSKTRRAAPVTVRTVHRVVGLSIVLFALWFGVTGVAVQTIDLAAIARHAPAQDPTIKAIRESLDGPSNFAVISAPDYEAPAFPAGYDFDRALRRVLTAEAAASGTPAPIAYVELRLADGRPTGLVKTGDRVSVFSAETGTALPAPPQPRPGTPAPSLRQAAKRLHRLFFLGDDMLWLNALVGLGLCAMIITGLVIYARLFAARLRMGRRGPFWSIGSLWRALHRSVAVVASLFLLVVAATGVVLSIDSLSLGVYRLMHPDRLFHGFMPKGMMADYSSPIDPVAAPAMLARTLEAYRAQTGDQPIKVVRLRFFAGMPQGVVISGGARTRQLIYNARTGAHSGLSGQGYPYTGFPTGWRLHELIKTIHRGDVIGVPGRLMAVFAGLSLIFLSISGLVTWFDMWRRRRALGRGEVFWR